MKNKYFITAMAALSLGASFTGCSHDIDSMSPGEQATDTYNRIFVDVFGQPAAEQTWGFGVQATPSRLTRTIVPDHDFTADIPDKPTTTEMSADNFLEEVPEGVEPYPADGYAIGTSYIDEDIVSSIDGVNIWGGGGTEENGWQRSGGTLYVSGNCDFSEKSFIVSDNMLIYLLKDATLTINNGFQGGTKVYIAPGARLQIRANVATGNVSYYNNGGSIDVTGNMVVNGGNELFCEGGSISVGGFLQLQAVNFYSHNTSVAVSDYIDVNHAMVNGSDLQTVYYQEGGTFTCDANLVANSGKFCIDVNSSFTSIEVNTNGVVYNKAGTMISAGIIKVYNNTDGSRGSTLINDGDLYGAYLGTEGSAFFQNNGITTIYGNTVVNSNGNTWMNNGTYNTRNFIYTAGSSDVINNCRLNVVENFNINLGDNDGSSSFRMDAGSGVVTKYFNGGGNFSDVNASYTGGPFYIYMGGKSVFKVTETATMNATKANYGIYGPTEGTDYAVFQARRIIKTETGEGNVTYSGKLYVSADEHFAQGYSGQYPFIHFKNGCDMSNIYASGDEAFSIGKPNITIAETTCNPGFTGDDTGTDTWGDWIRVIAEDLSVTQRTDFDFNDVVFDVRINSTNTKAQVRLKAAGGTLPLTVGWNGETGTSYNDYEVHNLYGVATNVMVNTQAKNGVDGRADVVKTLTGTFNNPNDVKVMVQKRGEWVELTAHQGEPASKLAVSTDYVWCTEREEILTRYPSFKTYVQENSLTEWWDAE